MPGVLSCNKRRCKRRKKYLEEIHILRIFAAYEVAKAREQLQAGQIDQITANVRDIYHRIDLQCATAKRDRIFRLLYNSCRPCYFGLNL